MARVSFEIKGKKVVPQNLSGKERQALEAAAHNVANVLASVRCEEHGFTPEVIARGDDVHHLEFRVRGCCATLVNAAMDQLRDGMPLRWWERDPIPKDPWVEV